MTDIRKPVPPAIAGDLVALVTPDQEARLANAMDTEALFSDVDHRVAVGLLEKPSPIFLAGAEEKMVLVEHAPPGDRRLEPCRDPAG